MKRTASKESLCQQLPPPGWELAGCVYALAELKIRNQNMTNAPTPNPEYSAAEAGLPLPATAWPSAGLSAEAVDALANTFALYETAIENRLFRALNQLE